MSLRRLSIVVLSWLCLGLLPASGWARDFILEKAYWTDASATATFEQARSATYTPYTGVLSQGFGPQAQWLRLKIDAVPIDGPATLVLRIRPVYLDSITLYDPLALAQGQSARITGDLSPWQDNEFESLQHNFVIAAQHEPREVWLRLRTTSTQLIHVEALSPREMLREEHRLWLIYSGLIALLLTCLVWVFLAWLHDRDGVNGIFVLRQTVLLAYTGAFLGYHRLLLSGWMTPAQQDMTYNWLVMWTTALSLGFEYRFLREYLLPRWGHWLFRGLFVISASAMGLTLAGQTRIALPLNMALNAAGLLSMLAVACSIQRPPARSAEDGTYHLPKPVVIGYYIVITSIITMSVLAGLGWLQGNLLSVYGVLFYGLISGLLMTALLIVRSRRIERQRQEIANKLFLSREQLTLEAKRRHDQTQLLSMLMHELKTPLSVIDMAVRTRSAGSRTTDYVTRAVGNIQGILERCIQTDRMVEREFTLQPQTVNLSDQVRQWLQDRPDHSARLQAQIEPGLHITSDLQCIQIIANNLIDNALKHGDALAPVQVRLATQTGEGGRAGLLLSVRNRPGPSGWPDTAKLFAKYYRSTSAQSKSGTGLGLFLSHNLAQQLGGALRYRTDDQFLCFELWLPT